MFGNNNKQAVALNKSKSRNGWHSRVGRCRFQHPFRAQEPAIRSQAPRFLRYWRGNLIVIALLLTVWWLVTFVPAYFARNLSEVFLFGWPFSFWVAAFGAPSAYLAMVGFNAWHMNRKDARLRRPDVDA